MSAVTAELALGAIAVGMAVATAAIVRLAADATDRRRRLVALFLLAMMAEMFVGAALYAARPSASGLVEGLSLSGGLMAATAAAVFGLWDGAAPEGSPPVAAGSIEGTAYLAIVVLLVTVSEALMAWTFASARLA